MKENKNQKRLLTVNDISCFGKCSVTVILPIISASGCECVPLPTAILSTHTGGFKGYTFLDMTEEMKKILYHWEKEEIFFDGILTGYLGNKEQIDICVKATDNRIKKGGIVAVDPVMGDSGKLYTGFDKDYVKAMLKLCIKADIITPNYTEACMLTGIRYREFPTEKEIADCFSRLKDIGIKSAAITGIKTSDGRIKTIYSDFSDTQKTEISFPYANATLHGGGDVFAAALCGKLLNGCKISESVLSAAKFTNACIEKTETEGQYGLNFEPLLSELKNF